MSHHGAFQAEDESISAYLERVELYFVANDIAADKQVPVLLSSIDVRTTPKFDSAEGPKRESAEGTERYVDKSF